MTASGGRCRPCGVRGSSLLPSPRPSHDCGRCRRRITKPHRPSWASPHPTDAIVGFHRYMATNPTIAARARVVWLAAALALAAALGGCFSTGSGIQTGERVDVYVSMPLHGPEARNGRDVVDAARLALADANGMAGRLRIRAIYMDDTSGQGAKS